MGKPDAMPFAITMTSGSIPACSTANIRPVRADPVCTSSARRGSRAPRRCRAPRARMPSAREVSAFSEHRLHHEGGRFARRGLRVEQQAEIGERAVDGGGFVDSPRERTRERRDEDACREWLIAGAHADLRGGHRHRQVRAAVEPALHDDDVGTAGGVARKLYRRFGCLRTRVGEEDVSMLAGVIWARRDASSSGRGLR